MKKCLIAFGGCETQSALHIPKETFVSNLTQAVTPFGKFMREKRIDEIPQFWNIVKGDMSLIGPRPERPAFCQEFEKRIHGWDYRTLVRPGLSGLAQVTGGYDLLPKEKVVLDLEYIEQRNVALDLKIILKTLGVVSTGEGAR